jgi:hypothetical protein
MPTVPTYDHALVSSEGLPAVRMTRSAMQVDIGEQPRENAKALSQWTNAMAVMTQQEGEAQTSKALRGLADYDTSLRFNASNAPKSSGSPADADSDGSEEGSASPSQPQPQPQPQPIGILNLKGEDAQKMPDGTSTLAHYGELYKNRISDFANTITDPEYKQKFVSSAQQLQATFMRDALLHGAVEYQNYRGQVIDDGINASISRLNTLAVGGDFPNQAGSASESEILNLIGLAQKKADFKGLVKPEERINFVSNIVANANANIVLSLNQADNPVAARQWFDERRAMFSDDLGQQLDQHIHATEMSVLPARKVEDLAQQHVSLKDGLAVIDQSMQGALRDTTRSAWIDHVQTQAAQHQLRQTQLMVPIYNALANSQKSQQLIGPADIAPWVKQVSQESPESVATISRLVASNNAQVRQAQLETTRHIRSMGGASNDPQKNASRLMSDIFTAPDAYMTGTGFNALKTLGDEHKLDPASLQETVRLLNVLKDPKRGPPLLSIGRQVNDYMRTTLDLDPGTRRGVAFFHGVMSDMDAQLQLGSKAPDLQKALSTGALRLLPPDASKH